MELRNFIYDDIFHQKEERKGNLKQLVLSCQCSLMVIIDDKSQPMAVHKSEINGW